MNLQDQVVSLELSKRLKELGVEQDSIFYWAETFDNIEKFKLFFDGKPDKKAREYHAFAVAELGEMLPCFTKTEKYLSKGKVRWNSTEYVTAENHSCHAESEVDSKARLLIHLIEKGIVKP